MEDLTSSDTIKQCSSLPKVKLLDALKSLMPSMLKSDGWKSYGNISRSAKIDSMITWNSSGLRWMSMKWKTKSRKWDKVFSLSRFMIESAALSLVSVRKSRDGVSSFLWSPISNINPWSHLIKDTGPKSKILSNKSLMSMKILSLTSCGTWDFLITSKSLKKSVKSLKTKQKWKSKSMQLSNSGKLLNLNSSH